VIGLDIGLKRDDIVLGSCFGGRPVQLLSHGLLPTVLSRRAYISYADRFVVLEPW
jgi:hypothetical protein